MMGMFSVQSVASSSIEASLRNEAQKVGYKTFTSPGYKWGTMKHIVLFKYAAIVTPEQKEEVIRRFMALRYSMRPGGTAPYIQSIIQGPQSSGEGAGQGYEQAFIVTFSSEGDRNYYVGAPIVNEPAYVDPQHDAFKAFVGPLLAPHGALVFDFLASSTKAYQF
ncbi:Dabb family protein [Serratia sp. OS31]|nr:Dabb family protein [Serratia sp. OS31]